MADKKSSAKRKKKGASDDEATPSKDETAVAKYLRFNLETKKSMMYGDEAHYFFGSKAVDLLLDSKWATGDKSLSVSFTHRDSVNAFLSKLLQYGVFSRVEIIKTEKKVKDKKKDADKKKEEPSKTEPKDEKKAPGTPKTKRDKDGKEAKKVRKKVKITLEPQEQQVFFDSDDEAYVWMYDPVSWKTFVLGVCLVIAIIVFCLFPLWPESIREYSWYLSVAGALFVGAVLILSVLRYILYGILWICTVGKLHFWLLPNLTEEVGFFESFRPLYTYEYYKKPEEVDESKSGDNENENRSDIVEEKLKELNKEESDKSSSSQNEEWIEIKKGDAEQQDEKEEINC